MIRQRPLAKEHRRPQPDEKEETGSVTENEQWLFSLFDKFVSCYGADTVMNLKISGLETDSGFAL